MHFHLPKPLHGWREFAGEVGIIVLGVLIALSFEQAVDRYEWNRKIERAEGAMRLELLGDDAPQAYARLLIAPCLDAAIARLHSGAGVLPDPQLRQLTNSYAPPLRTWESEAWNVALGSDIGSHMSPDRLVAWSQPYRSMAIITEWNLREHQLATDLREILPPSGTPSASQLQEFRRDAAELRGLNLQLAAGARLILSRMQANGIQMPAPEQKQLLDEAKTQYGTCVRAPDLGRSFEFTQFNSEDEIRRFALATR